MKYFFILGRQPYLSAAEIRAKLKQSGISFKETAFEPDFVILEIADKDKFNADKLAFELAGTIKIGVIDNEMEKVCATELMQSIPTSSKKIHFGLSAYNIQLDINKLGQEIKNELKRSGQSARFAVSKINPLSSAAVLKNKLLEKGAEIVILKSKTMIYHGHTLAIQPLEFWSMIDYGRPARDAKRGMLPPKLAQMMINLSEAKTDGALLDPFCGVGTIIQQSLLLGYANIIGCDIDNAAIKATKKNIDWLARRDLINQIPAVRFFVSDIKNLNKEVPQNSIDAVIAEPSLGPALQGYETEAQINKIIQDLSDLYRTTFIQLRAVLKPNGAIVIVIPSFRIKDKIYSIDLKKILPNGLKIVDQWPYSRDDQHVIRNILKIVAA